MSPAVPRRTVAGPAIPSRTVANPTEPRRTVVATQATPRHAVRRPTEPQGPTAPRRPGLRSNAASQSAPLLNARRVLLGALASICPSLWSAAALASPAQDYMLDCMGCHGPTAEGVPGKVPSLANSLGPFMRSPEGRNYVLRVPGAANSALSDAQLTAVLNWLAVTYHSTNERPQTPVRPFTVEEVAGLRHQPLVSVLATRLSVVKNLAAEGVADYTTPNTIARYKVEPSTIAPGDATARDQPAISATAPGAASHDLPAPIAAAIATATANATATATTTTATADRVFTGGKIYTQDSARSIATALAVVNDKVVFVGTDADAKQWIGPATIVAPLNGRLVLPGLIDSHVHPLDTVDLDVCDLESRPMSLQELATFVGACLARYPTPPGQRLTVHQWNYTSGNQPDPLHPTLRAALDSVSTKVQLQLLGNDAHHSAFNSLGLAHARNYKGQTVGLSKTTLAGEFAEYRPLVGVDSSGEPNGAVNEDARYLINVHSMLYTDLDAVAKIPDRIPERFNSVGITGVLDAMASPDGMPVYDRILADGKMTIRVTLAQFYDPSHTRTADGNIDYDAMVAQAKAIRAKYADNPLIKADFVKLFADGVLEGNPFAVPPTLPNAAALKPFLQPIYTVDADGHATVTGYVDTASAYCREVRAHPEKYSAAKAIAPFTQAHGHHPGQCAISSGQLQHSREVILEYVKRMHLAGFNVHIHAISNRSVRTAVDAIEAARAADGISSTRDSLAHLQLVDPEDVARIGRDHLFIAFTYAWMDTDTDYDLTVIPFFERIAGNSFEALHRPDSYFELNTYPVKAIKMAGGILAAGSDAPVETRDPRPFVNMSRAITRALPGRPPLSPQQSIPIRDVIEAYTINGARMLNLQDCAGSIEIGKSADFIVLDRDILALADSGKPQEIAATRVLSTWFRGNEVYRAPTERPAPRPSPRPRPRT